MRVVKYFYEEPASLEALAPLEARSARDPGAAISMEDFLAAPRYYRGYLAGSVLIDGAWQTGVTALLDPCDWLESLCSVLGAKTVRRVRNRKERSTPLRRALVSAQPGDLVLVGNAGAAPDLEGPTRQTLTGLTPLLDAGATVLLAEPAPDGADWTVLSPVPLADSLRQAFAQVQSAAQRFVIPHLRARGEHKFYFERYDLALFEAYRVSPIE